jgi:hypothetical protein
VAASPFGQPLIITPGLSSYHKYGSIHTKQKKYGGKFKNCKEFIRSSWIFF